MIFIRLEWVEIDKVKEFGRKHRYSIVFFAFLMLYGFIVPGRCELWQVNGITYSYHAVDFSMGFCTKFLPGAIYNFLFDEISYFRVSLYETILLMCLFAAVAVFLEKFILQVPSDFRKTALIVLLFFITGPCTFSMFIIQLGMLDVYWVFASVLFFICLFYKPLNIFIIPLFWILILVHYASVLCFVPFFAIIMLYRISCLEKKGEKAFLWIIWVLSVVTTICLLIYFLLYERSNLTYSMSEFNEILKSRGVRHFFVYDFSLYRTGGSDILADAGITTISGDDFGLKTLIDMVIQQIQVNFTQLSLVENIAALIFIIPVVFFIMKFLLYQVKKHKTNKLKRFSLVCMFLLFFVTLFFCILFSTDVVRWTGHAFLPLFVSFLFVIYSEGNVDWEYINTYISKTPRSVLIPYAVFYATSVFNPYA